MVNVGVKDGYKKEVLVVEDVAAVVVVIADVKGYTQAHFVSAIMAISIFHAKKLGLSSSGNKFSKSETTSVSFCTFRS